MVVSRNVRRLIAGSLDSKGCIHLLLLFLSLLISCLLLLAEQHKFKTACVDSLIPRVLYVWYYKLLPLKVGLFIEKKKARCTQLSNPKSRVVSGNSQRPYTGVRINIWIEILNIPFTIFNDKLNLYTCCTMHSYLITRHSVNYSKLEFKMPNSRYHPFRAITKENRWIMEIKKTTDSIEEYLINVSMRKPPKIKWRSFKRRNEVPVHLLVLY